MVLIVLILWFRSISLLADCSYNKLKNTFSQHPFVGKHVSLVFWDSVEFEFFQVELLKKQQKKKIFNF